jgi:hypothetical protein
MKKALLYAINDYGGKASNLRGCVNDAFSWKALLVQFGFEVTMILNKDVTRANFIKQIEALFKNGKSGDEYFIAYSGHGTQIPDRNGDEEDSYDEALYLVDGPLPDDDLAVALALRPAGSILTVAFDSCFSGDCTRALYTDNRFHPIVEKRLIKRKKAIARPGIDYVYLSGCGENQTSADAMIDGKYNGAFTYFACKTFVPGINYYNWHYNYRRALKINEFSQVPQLEGLCELFYSPVFGGVPVNPPAPEPVKKQCFLKRLFSKH